MTWPARLQQADAATVQAALSLVTPPFHRYIRNIVATFLKAATEVAEPPLQHALPVLALARAAAGLALVFGDPALIDLVAAEAHRALHDGSITVHDIFTGA